MNNYLSITYIKDKWGHAGFQKYFRNTGWMFFAKIASLGISFIATAYIARNLGPTNFGQLSYAVSYVGLFGFIASLGIEQVLFRDLVKYPEQRSEYLGTAIGLRYIASILTIILCFGSAYFLSPDDVSLILIFIISLTYIFNPLQLINNLFQADAKGKYPALLSTTIIFILNILKIIIIFLNEGVIYLALVILLEAILYALGFLYYKHKVYRSIEFRFKKNIALQILKDSFPLIFASAFFSIYARIDQVMLKNMTSTESVGLYDAAVRISELWYFIPNIIIASTFPAIVNSKKTSEELYVSRIRKLIITLLLISISTALFTIIFSKYLILIIFGTAFIGAVSVLNIYVWSNIGALINSLSQQILLIENKTKLIGISTFFGMIANVILNLYLIPLYGGVGAAYASLISYFVPFLSLFLFGNSRKKLINILRW